MASSSPLDESTFLQKAELPAHGFSGVLYSLMVFYAALYPRSTLDWGMEDLTFEAVKAPVFLRRTVLIEALLYLIGQTNVGHDIHIGGFLWGMLLLEAMQSRLGMRLLDRRLWRRLNGKG